MAIEITTTGMKAWPYKVHLPTGRDREKLQSIYDWLNGQCIKYEYASPRIWYFKHDIDASVFVLTWG